VNKAEAYRLWKMTVFRRRGRYYTIEEGRLVPATSFARFWRTVQLQQRLAATDPGGNIRL
jgi:hypothetical protein